MSTILDSFDCVHDPAANVRPWRRWFHYGIEGFCVFHVTVEFLIPWALKVL